MEKTATEKLLWISSFKNNKEVSFTLEMVNKTMFHNPKVIQSVFGNIDDNLKTFFDKSINIKDEKKSELISHLNAFKPTKIIVVTDVHSSYFEKLSNDSFYKLYSYLFLSYPYIKEEKILPILEKCHHTFVSSDYMKTHLMKKFDNKYSIHTLYYGLRKYDNYDKKYAREILENYNFLMNDAFVVLNNCSNLKKHRMDITIKAFVEVIKNNPQTNLSLFFFCEPDSKEGWNILELAETEFKQKDLTNHENYIKFINPANNFIYDMVCFSVDLALDTSDGVDFPLETISLAQKGVPQIVGNFNAYPEFFNESFSSLVNHNDEIIHPNHGGHEGGEGYLMDYKLIVEKIQKYINSPELLKEHSEKTRNHFENGVYSWLNIYKKFNSLVFRKETEKKVSSLVNENIMVRSLS